MHATEIVLALTPYLPYLAEGASKKLGEQATQSVVGLLKLFRERFRRASSKEALDDVQAKPDLAVNRTAFCAALEKELSDQPELAGALTPFIEGLRRAAPQVATNQNATVMGDQNTTVQAAGGSTVSINQRR